LSNLKRAIRENKADIGFALDPDQDRLVAMPLRSEEETLLLAGKFLLELQKSNSRKCIAKIPVNLSTSRAWEDLGEEYGVEIIRTPVGEINIARTMKKNRLPFGGEGNGGVILGEVNYGRNSTVGMALLLAYLAWSGKKLKTLERELPQYILLKEKIRVHSQQNPEEIVERAAAKVASTPEAMSISKEDGYKIFFRDNSWLQLRLSNTEPIIRIFAEGEAKKGKKKIKELINVVKTIINRGSQM
jgi:phosphomannomutase